MEAADGPELIDKATDAPWDIIISDISMPSLSGLEALAILRTRIPHIPILLTSIHTENSYALKALRSGAAGFIPKPLIQVELARAVITVLAGKKYLTAEQAIQIGNL
jgi:DNA-binding NarL/FixJ family response regulator